jgi:hypothetical protein
VRDVVKHRLALVDGNNDTQGYVAFIGDALRLSIAVVHRPPYTYRGTLTFAPEVAFGPTRSRAAREWTTRARWCRWRPGRRTAC